MFNIYFYNLHILERLNIYHYKIIKYTEIIIIYHVEV